MVHPTEALLRRAWDVASTRDADAFIPLCTEDVEFTIVSRIADPDDTPYCGHEGVREWVTESRERWSEFAGELVRVFPVEEGAVAEVIVRLRGQLSGAEVEWRGGQASRIRDGLLAGFSFHETLDEAAQALGYPSLDEAIRPSGSR